MVEYISVGDMMSGFVRLDNHSGHHQRCTSQFEEVIRCAHLVERKDRSEYFAEHFLEVVYGLHIVVRLSL